MHSQVGSATLDVGAIAERVVPVAQATPAVKRVYLFGSHARGEARPDSDVDLRAELDRTHRFGMFDLGRLYSELKEALGRAVDLVTADDLGTDAFARSLERDKVLLYERASVTAPTGESRATSMPMHRRGRPHVCCARVV